MLYFMIAILPLLSCRDKRNEVDIKTDKINIDSLEQFAFQSYSENPMQAAEIFKKVAAEYRELKNYKKSGQTNLNIAGIYEEKLSDYSTALFYSKQSLQDWKTTNDSMQIANLYKYVGYIEGLNNNYDKAEEDIQTAINIYTQLNFKQGIAVSNINMAKVMLLKTNYKEAKKYYDKSKAFWNKIGDKSRIFDNNLVGIRIFQKLSQTEQVSKLIQENELILKDIEVNKYLKDKFAEFKNEIR